MGSALNTLVVISWIFFHTIHAISPACECVIYDKTFRKNYGVFTSPDHPTPYKKEIRCLLYTFIAGPDEIVKISFDEFDVQVENPNCIFGDYIKLFLHLEQPKVNEHTSWNTILCGSLEDIDQIYYSAKNSLMFEFHSDWRNGNNTGFRGTYRFIKRKQYVTDGVQVPDTKCNYQFVSRATNTSRGRFFTPLYPSLFPRGSKCSYRFIGNINQRIRVIFEKVSFEVSDLSCLNSPDSVKVRDGKNKESPVITTICSSTTYIEARSTGPDLFIEFQSSSFFPKQGFKASYLFEDVEPSIIKQIPASTEPDLKKLPNYFKKLPLTTPGTPVDSCDEWINSDAQKTGTFSSPQFPNPYPPGTRCTYHFAGRGRERVQILFTDFDLGNKTEASCDSSSALTAYITIHGERSRIDDYCGRTLPPRLMSNGPTMTIDFSGITHTNAIGFKAMYKFVTDFGIVGGQQDKQSVCGFVYNSTISKSGRFSSPNHPGIYPRDTECHYFFHGVTGEKVQLTFSFFDVEGVLPCSTESASDYLEFSNYVTVDRKLGRACGRESPDIYKSDGDYFRVTFKSNDRMDGRGFAAYYQFVNATITDNLEKQKKIGTAADSSSSDKSGQHLCYGSYITRAALSSAIFSIIADFLIS